MGYYVNPGSILAIAILFPCLCTGAVITRFRARRYKGMQYGADDWVALVSLFFICAIGALLITGTALHLVGYHSYPKDFTEWFENGDEGTRQIWKLEYAFYPLSVLNIGFIRLTFAFLYRRIFRGPVFAAVNWTVITILTAWMVGFFFTYIFECGLDMRFFWKSPATFQQYCPMNFKLNLAAFITDLILDLTLLIIPIACVWQLQLKLQRKLFVMFVFALGIFSVACSATKTVLMVDVYTFDYGSENSLFGLKDGTSDSYGVISTVMWWTYVEIGVGSLVSNYPSLALLKDRLGTPLSAQFNKLVTVSKRKLLSTDASSSITHEASSEAGFVNEDHWKVERSIELSITSSH